jgi:hypothetical protein
VHSGALFLNCFEFFNHFAKLVQSNVLDLPDALARDTKFLADFLEGLFAAAIEPEAIAQDGRFPLGRGSSPFPAAFS